MQSSSLQPPPKSSSQPEGEHIKEDKGKKALSSEEAKKDNTNSDSDVETYVIGSMVEPSKIKKLKKFDFITEDGRHIYLTEEEINHQKKLEKDAKAEAAKQEGEVRKAELVDLLGPEVVKKYYNKKLQYDRYCDKMLNRRSISRITNCDVLTRKGPITLKVYREDGTRMDYIHTTEAELANKSLKSSVQYKDHFPGTVLNEHVLAVQRKPEGQWTRDERTATNLDQQLKSLIMFVLPDDQMNSVIKCLTARSTWDDLILYHKGPSDVKENSELASLFGKLKYEENLIDSIYETEKNKSLVSATPLSTAFISTSSVQDFQDSPDDEEDTRSSHEYLNDLKEKYQARALLAKSKRFFKKGTQRFSSAKATDQTECHKCGKKCHFVYQDFEAKYNKVKVKLALLSSSASASKATTIKNKGLITEAYKWDEEEGLLDDNEMVEVKVYMVLAKENDAVSKEGTRNSEWVKISMRKVQTLLEMKDNNDRKTYLDYLCIDLNYVEEQRNNLLSKHRYLVHELNACKEKLLVLKQAKLDFLTMQHVNTEILKENKNLRTELKELTAITKTWLNSSNKLSEAESFILPNHDTDRILPVESQRNIIDPLVVFTDSLATEYDSADESSVCSNPLPPLKKLDGAEPISGSKTIKSVLRSKSTFKAETLKGVKINEPSLAPAKGNKSSSTSKVNSALASKLKSVKIEDGPPLAIVIKELNDLKLQISKNQSSYSRNNQQVPQNALQNKYKTQFKKGCDLCGLNNHLLLCGSYDHDTNGHNRLISLEREINPRNPQHAFKRCEAYGSSTHTITDHDDIEWFKRGKALQVKKDEALKSTRDESLNANRSKTPTKSRCSRHMTGVKSYLHKYEEQPGPKVVFGDDSTCTTEGYGSIKCNGILFTKFDEKRGTIFNSNKEVVIIAPRTSSIKKCLHLLHMDLFGPVTPRSINHEKYTLVTVDEYSRNSILVNFCDKKGIYQNFSSPYTPEQNGVAKRKNKTLIEAARTMLSGSVFSKQYWTEAIAIACYTQTDPPLKFDEKADDGYILGYSLVSKAFRVFNTRRQQTKETYHIIFNESFDAIKFLKPSVDNINITENERYPPNEYLHPYEPSQRYQTNSNVVSFIEPCECPELVVLETKVASDQNGQTDQNDEILNDGHSEHSNHTNDEQIIDNLQNTKDI
ncbi:retrovirus-related pol polyprotein from transposon TNT 1-94 [Tanacetum coccineum]